MKTNILLKSMVLFQAMILLSSGNLSAQNMGFGLRFGDPTGFTFKKYNGDKAIEISLGRTHWINGNGWYNKHYNYWYDKNYSKYSDFAYVGHRAYTPLGIQVNYLIHKDFKNSGTADLTGLKWYFGFGGSLGYQKYSYDYRYKVNGNPDWIYIERETHIDLDLGVNGVIGLEYTFEEVPISVFLDATLYMELFDQPFLFGWFSGLGGRYNF